MCMCLHTNEFFNKCIVYPVQTIKSSSPFPHDGIRNINKVPKFQIFQWIEVLKKGPQLLLRILTFWIGEIISVIQVTPVFYLFIYLNTNLGRDFFHY